MVDVWSLLTELDTLDLIIFAGLLIGGAYFLFSKTLGKKSDSSYRPSGIVNVTPVANGHASAHEESNFIGKMKKLHRNVAIFYGSQTGTAEELAGRLAKDAARYGLKAMVFDPEECEMEDLTKLSSIDNALAIFCMSTYGEGDPTDNAQQFNEFLQNGGHDLNGLKYAVFALGNKTYEHFNSMGKLTDQKLEEMGGVRVYSLGLGDDDGNLEEDFMRWREGFWPRVCEVFNVQASGEDVNMRNYRLELIEPNTLNDEQIFTGEIARLGSYKKQRPPFDLKNPFMAPVAVNRELHKGGGRSCKHIEFDTNGSRLRYEAGDHVGIYATNETELVNKMEKLLGVDLDQVFKLINLDEDSSKKHPFPCPTTYRVALTYYVDLTSPLKSHVIKELANHCTDDAEKKHLTDVSSPSEEGLKLSAQYIHAGRRSILDVLSEHPTCKPPLDLLLEVLPRLQVRYYSISSSPRVDANRVAVTAVVVDYTIEERRIKGVCTNYLKNKVPAGEQTPKCPIFIRKSTLRLPHRHHVPVIMIGPGTGFAPFRGFLQDRDTLRKEGKEIGPMVLYYGCRRRKEDFIYEDEINQWLESGTLTELHCAFSREEAHKVYVQHKLWDNRENTWKMLNEQQAHVYICGDAKNMSKDVMETFHRILKELGGKSETEAAAYMKQMEREKRYQADVWS